MEQLPCPNCGKKVDPPGDLAVRDVVCPQCGTWISSQPTTFLPDSTENTDPRQERDRRKSSALTRACRLFALLSLVPILGIASGIVALVLGVISIARGNVRPVVGHLALAAFGTMLWTGYFVFANYMMEMHARAICGANVNSIGKAIQLYQSEWEGSYPWIVDVRKNISLAEATARPTQGADTLHALGRRTRNIVENLNALVASEMVSYKVFRCPSVGSDIAEHRLAGEDGYNDVFGFLQLEGPGGKTRYYCDFAYHLGYPNLSAAGDNPAPTDGQLHQRFAILADANPGMETLLGKGSNHGTDGISVLMADLSVHWVTPDVEETSRGQRHHPLVRTDNLYGAGRPGGARAIADGVPTSSVDQVLHSPR